MKNIKIIRVESILIDKLPINKSVLNLVWFILSGGVIPPIHVEISPNGGYKIKDGRHRVCAFKLLGYSNIEVRISKNNYNNEKEYYK